MYTGLISIEKLDWEDPYGILFNLHTAPEKFEDGRHTQKSFPFIDYAIKHVSDTVKPVSFIEILMGTTSFIAPEFFSDMLCIQTKGLLSKASCSLPLIIVIIDIALVFCCSAYQYHHRNLNNPCCLMQIVW